MPDEPATVADISNAYDPERIRKENESLRQLVKALVWHLGENGTATLPEKYMVEDYYGDLLIYRDAADSTVKLSMTCMNGHTPDDPAPWRDKVCRVCGGVVQEGHGAAVGLARLDVRSM
jgi:hypothetical protein